MTALVPLAKSYNADTLEQELTDLTVSLYEEYLQPTADQINVYGAPYLGDISTIQQFVQQEGLSLINTGDETAQVYVFKAWRYRNPRRGLHFARLFLQTLYPGQFTIDQLWQQTSGTYPNQLATTTDMQIYGYDPTTYWRTSRVRVDLSTQSQVPTQILNATRTTLAAKFLLEMRVVAGGEITVGVGGWMGGAQVVRTVSNAAPGVPMGGENMTYAQYAGAANVAYMAGQH